MPANGDKIKGNYPHTYSTYSPTNQGTRLSQQAICGPDLATALEIPILIMYVCRHGISYV